MTERADLYSNYQHFTDRVLDAIRKETFGTDIGQNSWVTVDEYDRFIRWLKLEASKEVLEVASGSGGPALYLARTVGCRVIGIDENEGGIETATQAAAKAGLSHLAQFKVADATITLPFAANSFDALLCIDAMNHLLNRLEVLKEWQRVLRPGGRAVFTDPVVITGPITNDELRLRSLIGLFLYVPPGVNEQMIKQAAFQLVQQEDASANAALVSGRWHKARQAHKDELIKIEGEERYRGLQEFFAAVHKLTSERRLSRIVYLIEKP